jgi:hypothetical protein
MKSHFEPKFYSCKDALADAALLIEQTEDRAYTLGKGDHLRHSGASDDLFAALQAHYKEADLLRLGVDMCRGIGSAVHIGQVPISGAHSGSLPGPLDADFRAHTQPQTPLDKPLPALSLPRNLRVDTGGSSHIITSSAANLRQMKKDFERDRVIINGRYVVGAESGVEEIQALLISACEHVLLSFDGSLLNEGVARGSRRPSPSPSPSQQIDTDADVESGVGALLADLCQRALLKASRSNSAGSSLIALDALLSSVGQSQPLRPLSDLAPPLCIRAFLGTPPSPASPCPQSSSRASPGSDVLQAATNSALRASDIAIICQVECTSFFVIRHVESDLSGKDTSPGDSLDQREQQAETEAKTETKTEPSAPTTDPGPKSSPGVSSAATEHAVRLVFTDSVFVPIRMSGERPHMCRLVYDGDPVVAIDVCNHLHF